MSNTPAEAANRGPVSYSVYGPERDVKRLASPVASLLNFTAKTARNMNIIKRSKSTGRGTSGPPPPPCDPPPARPLS